MHKNGIARSHAKRAEFVDEEGFGDHGESLRGVWDGGDSNRKGGKKKQKAKNKKNEGSRKTWALIAGSVV